MSHVLLWCQKTAPTWTVGHRESALWLASGPQQHHAKGANSGKGQDTITDSPEQRWEGDTCSSPGGSGQAKSKHLQAESRQGHHAGLVLQPSPLYH